MLKTGGYECQITSYLQHESLLLTRAGGEKEAFTACENGFANTQMIAQIG